MQDAGQCSEEHTGLRNCGHIYIFGPNLGPLQQFRRSATIRAQVHFLQGGRRVFGKRQSSRFTSGLITLALLLSACGGAASVSSSSGSVPPAASKPAAASPAASSKPSAAASASAAAKPGAGGNTFVWGKSGDPVKLDPAIINDGESSQVTHMIFDGLVAFKPGTTDVIPALAEKWTTSPD